MNQITQILLEGESSTLILLLLIRFKKQVGCEVENISEKNKWKTELEIKTP